MHGRVSGVAFEMREELWDYVTEWEDINSWLMWVRLKVRTERSAIFSAYGPVVQ